MHAKVKGSDQSSFFKTRDWHRLHYHHIPAPLFAVIPNTWVPRAGLLLRLVVVDLKQSSEGAFADEDSNPPFRFTRYQAGVQFVSAVEVMSCWVHRTAANMANRPGQRWKQGSVASRVTLGALVKHIPGTLEHLQPCLAFDAPGGLVPFFVAYA